MPTGWLRPRRARERPVKAKPEGKAMLYEWVSERSVPIPTRPAIAPERQVVIKIIPGAFTPLARAARKESPVARRLKPNTVLLSMIQ